MLIITKPIEIVAVLLLAAAQVLAQTGTVQGSRIRAHVRFLSSDLLEGRGVGTRGGQLTEEYLAAQLAAAGVQPAGEGGTYFQRVPMVGVQTGTDSLLSASSGSKAQSFRWQTDFVGASHRQRAAEDFEAETPGISEELLTDQGFLRTSPPVHDMDGFFAAVLVRKV